MQVSGSGIFFSTPSTSFVTSNPVTAVPNTVDTRASSDNNNNNSPGHSNNRFSVSQVVTTTASPAQQVSSKHIAMV